MDIHHLRVFVSVYRHRSFSKAAEELHLTQPTVSGHVRSLERELGCSLFDRLPRKVMPTREASVLVGLAQEILEKLDGFTDILGASGKDLTGHLLVGASSIPGTYILPGLTAAFRKKYPSVLVEVSVSDSRVIIDRVAGADLLIGVVGSRLPASQVEYRPFLDDELIAVASGTLGMKRTIGIRELFELPLIVREPGSGTRTEFEKILVREMEDPNRLAVVGIFGSTDAVKQAVKQGMGISILSRRSVKDELKCGILHELRIRGVEMKRTFYIVTHRGRTLPHLHRIFLEFLLRR